MSDDEFKAWCKQHAALFGAVEAVSFLAWRRVFEAAGYTAAELAEASDWLALNRLPRWPNEHLAGITVRIKDRRAVEYRREVQVSDDGELGTCTLCGGSGRVIVPHRLGVRNASWVAIRLTRGLASHYTEAVLCRCALGRWVGSRIFSEEQRPSTLADYEKINPHWPEQMRARQKEMLAAVDAAGVPESAEEVQRMLVQRLRGLALSAGIGLCPALARQPGEDD